MAYKLTRPHRGHRCPPRGKRSPATVPNDQRAGGVNPARWMSAYWSVGHMPGANPTGGPDSVAWAGGGPWCRARPGHWESDRRFADRKSRLSPQDLGSSPHFASSEGRPQGRRLTRSSHPQVASGCAGGSAYSAGHCGGAGSPAGSPERIAFGIVARSQVDFRQGSRLPGPEPPRRNGPGTSKAASSKFEPEATMLVKLRALRAHLRPHFRTTFLVDLPTRTPRAKAANAQRPWVSLGACPGRPLSCIVFCRTAGHVKLARRPCITIIVIETWP